MKMRRRNLCNELRRREMYGKYKKKNESKKMELNQKRKEEIEKLKKKERKRKM